MAPGPSLHEHQAHERYSPRKRPDITNFSYGRGGAHQLLDVKVFSSLTAAGQPTQAADRDALLWSITGRARRKVDRDYAEATRRTHTVLALTHSAFGAVAPDAVSLLRTLDREVRGKLPDPENGAVLLQAARTVTHNRCAA